MAESLGEADEVPVAKTFYPDSSYTNPEQKGVDLTTGGTSHIEEVYVATRTGGYYTVVETREGGTWVQIKSLQPVKTRPDGSPDLAELQKRIKSNLDLSVVKADQQFDKPVANTRWSADGDKYRLNLTKPDNFEVFVKVPGFEGLTIDQQASIRAGARQAIEELAAAYEFKVPSSVRVEGSIQPPPATGTVPAGATVDAPEIISGGEPSPGRPAMPDELAGAISARGIAAGWRGATPGEAEGLVSGITAVFLVYTVGEAAYIYVSSPEGEKAAALGSFGINTLTNVALSTAAAKLFGGAAGVGVGFSLGLASDNGTDPEQEDRIQKLTQQLFPNAKGDEFEQRQAEVGRAIKHAKPRDVGDEPVPIVRTLEPMLHVVPMDGTEGEAPVVGSIDRPSAYGIAKSAAQVGQAKSAALASGSLPARYGVRAAQQKIENRRTSRQPSKLVSTSKWIGSTAAWPHAPGNQTPAPAGPGRGTGQPGIRHQSSRGQHGMGGQASGANSGLGRSGPTGAGAAAGTGAGGGTSQPKPGFWGRLGQSIFKGSGQQNGSAAGAPVPISHGTPFPAGPSFNPIPASPSLGPPSYYVPPSPTATAPSPGVGMMSGPPAPSPMPTPPPTAGGNAGGVPGLYIPPNLLSPPPTPPPPTPPTVTVTMWGTQVDCNEPMSSLQRRF